jgi:ubiquinone/menaquinone biosynthesis C-methylase UbiE
MRTALKPAAPATEAIDIAWLADTIRRNRFMPTPAHEQVFVGDGDFLAIGAEFLRHSVDLAGLMPDARLVDIGCGIGRLAVPLTQYLDPERGSYDGLDPVLAGIEWCRRHITPAYPRFRFHHFDVRHPIYHSGGSIAAVDATLPFEDESFDFACMISLVTHLTAVEVKHYLSETARVLSPGGTLLLSAFIVDEGARNPRLKFARGADGPEWYAVPDAPLSAVAFDNGFIDRSAEASGLSVRLKRHGNWTGKPADHFQDLFVIRKPVDDQ